MSNQSKIIAFPVKDHSDLSVLSHQEPPDFLPPQAVNFKMAVSESGEQDRKRDKHSYLSVGANLNAAKPHYSLGKALAKKGECEKAIYSYRKALELDSNSAEIYQSLGDTLVKTGELDEAVIVYQKAIELQPSLWEVHHNLGDIWQGQGRLDEAVAAYRLAIELNPDFCWSHNNLGDVLIKQEKWEEAVEGYRSAIGLNPDFHWSHYNLGEALAELERWEEAIGAYRRAMRLQPELPQIQEKLGDTLKQQILLASAEAVQLYTQAIHKNHDNIELYHKVLEFNSNDATLYLQLGNTLARQNNPEEALVFYQMGLKVKPEYAEISLQLNKVRDTLLLREALTNYQQAVSLAKQERWSESIVAYRKAFEVSPRSDSSSYRDLLGTTLDSQRELAWSNGSHQNSLNVNTQVTIVIPIFNAYEDTKNCVESVLKYTNYSYELLLMDDGSQDRRVTDFAARVASQHPHVIFIKNHQNLGFVKTCNTAFKVTSTTDIVLLNSDTVVTANWLEKLTKAAYLDPKIATVTPLTNNGEISSVPHWLQSNTIPAGQTIDSFAELIEKISFRRYPIIPTGVGFCMYMKREVLNAIGGFDELHFGKGYGEENDWCRRAVNAGYYHIIDDSTFIYHSGGKSFGNEEKEQLVLNNFKPLEKLHPTYFQEIQNFIKGKPVQDILSNIRLHLQLEEIRSLSPICYIIHNGTDIPVNFPLGGTEHHCAALILEISKSRPVYTLCFNQVVSSISLNIFYRENKLRFEFPCQDFSETPYLAKNTPVSQLWVELLQYLQPSLIHIHHLKNLPLADVMAGLKKLAIPYWVTLHDYYFICPSYNLLDYQGQFCFNHKSEKYCRQCIQSIFQEGEDLKQKWHQLCEELMMGASTLITPSEAAHSYLVKEYPNLKDKISIIRHGIANESDVNQLLQQRDKVAIDDCSLPIKIAFVGGITVSKGLNVIFELLEKIEALPELRQKFEFEVCGALSKPLPPSLKPIKITGEYQRQNLPKLLSSADVVMFPGIWPETYCLVADEVLALGIPIISTPLGALAERINQFNLGWVSKSCSSDDLLQILISMANEPGQISHAKMSVKNYQVISHEVMAQHYTGAYEESINHGNLSNLSHLDRDKTQLKRQSIFLAYLNSRWFLETR